MSVAYMTPQLPWEIPEEEQRRFRRILLLILGLFLFLGLVMPWLPVPEDDREKTVEVPPRIARLVMQRRATPPKPVQRKKEAPRPKAEKAKPKKPPKTVRSKPARSAPARKAARQRAEKAGVLAFRDELAALRETPAVSSLGKRHLSSGAAPRKGHAERALVTAAAGRRSSGINTAALSRDTGGGGVRGGHRSAAVSSSIGTVDATGGNGRKGRGHQAGRTPEEIQLVFDRNKHAIYALYNRALRKDPTLRGKVVLRLTIAPSGKVVSCRIVSSELNHPRLERKLVLKVKRFDFGAKDVATLTIDYPIDFFPA